MKKVLLWVLVVALVTIFSGLARAGSFMAGAGKADITPDGLKKIPLAGYGARFIPVKKYSTGVHDRIFVRALIMQTDQARVALVICDALLITKDMRDQILERVRDLKLDELILSANHTHSGMGGYVDVTMAEIAVMGPYNPEARRIIMDGIEKALREAAGNMIPARIGSAVGDAPRVSANRRHEGGPVDTDMGVIKVESESGQLLVLLANFGVHPTLIHETNLLVSGDIAGRMESTMEQRHPGARGMFFNAGLGDQKPYSEFQKESWDEVAYIGDTMADQAEAIAKTITATDQVNLTLYHRTFAMPQVYLNPSFSCWYGLNPIVKKLGQPLLRTEGELFGLGINNDTLILASPAELATDIEKQLIAAWPDKKVFVFTHSNDIWGYVVTPDDYRTGGYETCMNFYGPEFGDEIVKQYKMMVGGK